MTHTYNITGMTCKSCVAKVKNELLKLGDVSSADVQLESPQATIDMQRHIATAALQEAVGKAGAYQIAEADGGMTHIASEEAAGNSWLATYKPILLVGAYITGITLLIEASKGYFDMDAWMRHFMAAFFLVFSFFKLLDLNGFADSYSTYDLIARRWRGWGYVYAFTELGLGLAYLINIQPLLTNMLTLVVMTLSIIGVLQNVLAGKKIRCACLGAVFNLPMSSITLIEDGLMIAMSGYMVITLL